MGIEKRREPREECYLHVRVRSSCDYLADMSDNGARLMTCGNLTGPTVNFADSQGQRREYQIVWCNRLPSGWTEAGLSRVFRTKPAPQDCSTDRMRSVLYTLTRKPETSVGSK